MTGPVHLALRRTTAEHHRRLEAGLDIPASLRERRIYRHLVERFYGFYVPFERLLARFDWARAELDFEHRLKSPLLRRDLLALGHEGATIAGLPVAPQLPTPTTLAGALGCLYVAEGATLGGQVIGRHLHVALGIHRRNGGAFFASYGQNAGVMWAGFRKSLERHCGDARATAEAAGAALQTFAALEVWLLPGAPSQALNGLEEQ